MLASLALAGCRQYDPHAHLYTTSEPKTEDVIGTYVLDEFHLPPEAGNSRPEVVVDLHADGTYAAANVPPWEEFGTPGKNFFKSLLTATGKWQKRKPGSIWGVDFSTRALEPRVESAYFTGDKPPYGLIFTLGDPNSGHAVILKKKQ